MGLSNLYPEYAPAPDKDLSRALLFDYKKIQTWQTLVSYGAHHQERSIASG